MDWIVLSYSRAANWHCRDTVPVAASGAPFIPPCRLVPHSPYNEVAALLMPWGVEASLDYSRSATGTCCALGVLCG